MIRIIFIGFILLCFLSAVGTSCTPKNTRYEDMTNKEYQNFMEWDRKQQQKNWENEKFFK